MKETSMNDYERNERSHNDYQERCADITLGLGLIVRSIGVPYTGHITQIKK